jgi:cellulose synthase/poly-beta-1,6-N-acetylglucosamine synthase-like glycosyltransferase
VGNDCTVRGGFLEEARVSDKLLVAFQVVEYLRAFFFGRMGWEPFNAVMIISGAFGMFDRQALLDVGGYVPGVIGEDMEIVLKLHKHSVEEGLDHNISYVPDPVCWTEVPEDLTSLQGQRERWQIGLAQSMWEHKGLFLNPRGGWLSWVAYPWMLIFELTGPIVEVAGYLYMITGLILGFVSWTVFAVFTFMAIGLGMILSIGAVLIEELSFHKYKGYRHLPRLFGYAFLENLGYRQINSFWRLFGLFRWMFGSVAWGVVDRLGLEREDSEKADASASRTD